MHHAYLIFIDGCGHMKLKVLNCIRSRCCNLWHCGELQANAATIVIAVRLWITQKGKILDIIAAIVVEFLMCINTDPFLLCFVWICYEVAFWTLLVFNSGIVHRSSVLSMLNTSFQTQANCNICVESMVLELI